MLWSVGWQVVSLFLDFLGSVVWNRKEVIGMNGFDLCFCGGTLTVVSCWQSVGCQRTFPRLVVHLVVIFLKSPQKGVLAFEADAWGSCVKNTRGFWSVPRMAFLTNIYCWLRSIPRTGAKKLPLDLWVLPLCRLERHTYRCDWFTMLHLKKASASLHASPWFSVRSISLKYSSTDALETASLTSSKAFFSSWVKIHSHSCVSGNVVSLTFLKGF